VAERGLWSDAPRARRVRAGGPAVRRVGARQRVDVTPGRPLVRPRGRRPAAGNGVPRSRWLKALGVHDPRVAWGPPTTGPAWRPRAALAALPETGARREGRDHRDTPGVRTRPITLVTTRLDAASSRGADRAERDHERWRVETALAHLTTTMPMDVLHGKPVPGVLKELLVCALVYPLVRLVMRHSATLQHPEVERLSGLDALRWRSAPRPGMPRMPWLVNPARPHRVEPRGKKRHPKSVPCMIKPRPARRQQLVQQELSGSLHVIRVFVTFGEAGDTA
jgi:hypothetical protein